MSDDDTTRIIVRRSSPSFADLSETKPISGQAGGGSLRDEDSHTKIFRPSKPNNAINNNAESSNRNASSDSFAVEPVVGWLVVIEGPGRGQSLKLGYGMNSIGRGGEARVSLDFGDEEISRQGHAMLTYDTKGRKFYIQHGGGTNLTYLGDIPVLQAHELKGREIIGIGNTKLCFVPFCGTDFEW